MRSTCGGLGLADRLGVPCGLSRGASGAVRLEPDGVGFLLNSSVRPVTVACAHVAVVAAAGGESPRSTVRHGQSGGGEGTRTPDLGIANAALSQLSYAPTKSEYETPTRVRQTTRVAPRPGANAVDQPSSSPGSNSIRIRPATGSTSRITSGMAGISRSRAPSRRTR